MGKTHFKILMAVVTLLVLKENGFAADSRDSEFSDCEKRCHIKHGVPLGQFQQCLSGCPTDECKNVCPNAKGLQGDHLYIEMKLLQEYDHCIEAC